MSGQHLLQHAPFMYNTKIGTHPHPQSHLLHTGALDRVDTHTNTSRCAHSLCHRWPNNYRNRILLQHICICISILTSLNPYIFINYMQSFQHMFPCKHVIAVPQNTGYTNHLHEKNKYHTTSKVLVDRDEFLLNVSLHGLLNASFE